MNFMTTPENEDRNHYQYHYPMQNAGKKSRFRTKTVLIAFAVGFLGFFASRMATNAVVSALDSYGSENTAYAGEGSTSAEQEEQESLKVGEIDVFDGLEVTFSGTSPLVKAAITANPNSYPINLDRTSGLANGDTVTATFVVDSGYSDEQIAGQYGGKPQATEKEYTVEGLPEYVDSTNDLTPQLLAPLKSEEEAKIAADYSTDEMNRLLTFGGTQYIGAVVQHPADGGSEEEANHNALTLVYKIDASIRSDVDYEEKGEDLSYYTFVRFYNVVLNGDGSGKVESDFREYPGSANDKVLFDQTKTYINGYLDGRLSELVYYLTDTGQDDWTYVTDLEGL